MGLYTKLFYAIIPTLFLCVLQFRYLTSTTSRFHRFMYESDSFVTTCMHYIGGTYVNKWSASESESVINDRTGFKQESSELRG